MGREETNGRRANRPAGKIALLLFAGAALVCSPSAFAEEAKGPAVSADLTVASKYVWRGLRLTDDPVLQPSLTVDYRSLGLNIWGNTDLTDVNGTPGEINELDYTLSYSLSAGPADVTLGVIQYTFPHTAFEPTTEIYGSVGISTLLSPTVTVYYDSDEVGGLYGTFGASHSFPLGEVYRGISPSLDLSGSIAYATSDWNEGYYGVSSSGLVDLLLTAGLSVPVDDRLSFTPFVSYSKIIDSELEDAVEDDDTAFFGATLSYTF